MKKLLELLEKLLTNFGPAVSKNPQGFHALLAFLPLLTFTVIEAAAVAVIAISAQRLETLLENLHLSPFAETLTRYLHCLTLAGSCLAVASLMIKHSPGPLGDGLRGLIALLEFAVHAQKRRRRRKGSL